MGQGLPDFLGEEGHEGMQELERLRERIAQYPLGLLLGGGVLPLQAGLGHLNVPVAIGVPDKVVNLLGGHPQLVVVHVFGDFRDDGVELGENPLIFQLQLLRQGIVLDGQVHHQEAGGIPNLIGKVPHGLAPLRVKAHVVAGGVAGDQVKAQGIGAVFLRHFQGVNAVAQGLGHLPPLVVPDQAVDENGVEGGLFGLLTAGEDHPGHPEKDDVITGDQHVSGVEIVQILGFLRPAQGGEGPQRGGEPGVQHVRVPLDMGRAALGADGGIGAGDSHVAAVVAVPHGNLMPPPQLPGDAPVVDVFHPVKIGLGEAVGDKLGLSFLHHPVKIVYFTKK